MRRGAPANKTSRTITVTMHLTGGIRQRSCRRRLPYFAYANTTYLGSALNWRREWVGKTSVTYRLAHHYQVGITEVDDFQVILEHMTTPEQQPILHYWQTHPEEAQRMDEDQQLAFMLRYSQIMATALELVIANHLESHAPVLLEGDFILPSLAVQSTYNSIPADGRVRGIFVHEDDERQISHNYRVREGKDQPKRARASWRHSKWLRQEAGRLGVPTIAARPWGTVFERIIAALAPAS